MEYLIARTIGIVVIIQYVEAIFFCEEVENYRPISFVCSFKVDINILFLTCLSQPSIKIIII